MSEKNVSDSSLPQGKWTPGNTAKVASPLSRSSIASSRANQDKKAVKPDDLPPSLPPLPPSTLLRASDNSHRSSAAHLPTPARPSHRRSKSAGSMKALTGEGSGQFSPPTTEKKGKGTPILGKQKSSLNKFFTASRNSGTAAKEPAAEQQRELTLHIMFVYTKKEIVLKCAENMTVREVLDLFISKNASKTKKFVADNNCGSEKNLGMQLFQSDASSLWLQEPLAISCYCAPDGSPPGMLVVNALPQGGAPPGMLLPVKVLFNEKFLLVEVDYKAFIRDAMDRCVAAFGGDAEGHYLVYRSQGKGIWLDPDLAFSSYLFDGGVELELAEPNFVVLQTLKGHRFFLDGASTGESFLRTQLRGLGVAQVAGSYYSLFKGATVEEWEELPTWQTIAKMGFEEKQLIHLGQVDEGDVTPVSLCSYLVDELFLQQQQQTLHQQEFLMASSPPEGGNSNIIPSGGSTGAKGATKDDKRDWHAFLKLYVDEDILAKVEGAHLLSSGGISGVLCLTNASLVFKSDKTYLRVFNGMISKIDKVGTRQTKKKPKGSQIIENLMNLEIHCKDFSHHTFSLPKQKNFLETLMMLAFPKKSTELYAFSYRLPASVTPDPANPDGWKYYDPKSYHERMGVGTSGSGWSLSDVNIAYNLCDTYPAHLAFPSQCSVETLKNSASFRSRGRLPALSYLHRNGASITRCSQPKVGLIGGSSEGDKALLKSIFEANPNKDNASLRLIDARPKLNAIANQAMGKGSERVEHYPFECSLEFANIDNIHVMRQSFVKLVEACRASRKGEVDWNGWQNLLASSGWLGHVQRVLIAGVKVARYVGIEKHSVVLHCSDGWDRTAQLSSLSMILLNPYFRTMRGFCELIEKEWLAFGHQFARRHGHCEGKMEQDGDSQRSPVFLQFLDCTWQLTQLHPCAFEYTGFFLGTVIEEVYNCRFGTFLYDCERERKEAWGATVSLWTYVLSPSVIDLYKNPLFKPNSEALLNEIPPHALRIWDYYDQKLTRQEDLERVREISMRIEMLEALLAAEKKKNSNTSVSQ